MPATVSQARRRERIGRALARERGRVVSERELRPSHRTRRAARARADGAVAQEVKRLRRHAGLARAALEAVISLEFVLADRAPDPMPDLIWAREQLSRALDEKP